MHCKNRSGERILKYLLIEGYNDRKTKAEQDAFIKQVEGIVNTRILGKPWRRSRWQVHRDKKTGQVLDQMMPNSHARKFVENIGKLTRVAIQDVDRRKEWNETVGYWQELMELARQKDDFSDDDIARLDDLSYLFFDSWVELLQGEGVSNYFHMVGAGHMTYYAKEWRNFYRYSQQGWENLNSWIKSFFFRRTQRGGFGGKQDQRNSKVAPIARWMQRTVYWRSGLASELFEDKEM